MKRSDLPAPRAEAGARFPYRVRWRDDETKKAKRIRKTGDLAFVRIAFHGDVIVAGQDGDGEVWVVIRAITDRPGANFGTQLRNLKGYDWAVVVMKATNGRDGKVYGKKWLPRRCLASWLTHIDPPERRACSRREAGAAPTRGRRGMRQ